MSKLFDGHVHYSFEIPLEETIEIFREEFAATDTVKYAFMALPHHATEYGLDVAFDDMQNLKGLYLKRAFSPNAYCFAGLEHPLGETDKKKYAANLLKQAETYAAAGYDGMKMLEGYPSMRKAMKLALCDEVYDPYYSFLEENGIPITMHIANPAENWDPMSVSEYARSVGRYCDHTFPTKAQLHAEVDEIMRKHPRLKLMLAHFGFLTYDINQARRWLDEHENTLLDMTPGGEQYFNMAKNWDEWHDFFVQYQDRIVYGSDFYAFPKDEKWEENFKRRTNFVRQFLQTDTEHLYIDTKFRGVALEENICQKLLYENGVRVFGAPKAIDAAFIRQTAQALLEKNEHKDPYATTDLHFILKNV